MAPARHPDKLNKISAKISGSIDTRLRPSGGNSSEMDLKKTATVEGNISGVQDSVETVEKEPWFEDKLPGDGRAENSFSALYNNSISWEIESDSSKNKSWFDLVEEDEADVENRSLNHEDTSIREQALTNKSIETQGVKVKKEVIDEDYLNHEDRSIREQGISDHSIETQDVKVKVEVVYEDEHDDFDDHYEVTTSDLPVLTNTKQDKCATVEKRTKSPEKTKTQKTLEEKSIKQEKQLENVPMKRERNSTNTETVNSKCQRGGKKIKQEIACEGLSGNKNKHDSTDEKLTTLFTDAYDKAHIKVKDELNSKCSNNGDGSELYNIRNRKRTLDTSMESVGVKRERSASSSSSSNNSVTQKKEYERDPEILSRRQKQIDYGKNTVGYDRYRQQIPKETRTIRHPRTPPKHIKYSRRGWDGMIRVWRQQLHGWDPDSEMGNMHDSVSDTSVEVASVTSDDVSDCLQSDYPLKLSTSTPSGSVDHLDNADYLNLHNEELDHLLN